MRRTVILLPMLLVLTAACSSLPGGGEDPLELGVTTAEVVGLVVGLDGAPVPGATVTSDVDEIATGPDGRFSLAVPASPSYVRVRADGHLTRTEAAQPGRPLLSRLTRQDGRTVSLRFGGDIMAGRRFYDRDEDGRRSDAMLRPGATVADHMALLRDVQPLLEDPDLMIANLESPLTTEPAPDPTRPRPGVFHPTKEFAFASAPELARALAETGFDVIDIGNNHLYDRLGEGVAQTIEALDAAGLPRYGSGRDIEEAWEPARVDVRGQRFAFVGCTSITGEEHPEPYIAGPDRAGAAGCDQERLRDVVRAERATGATVVASIHGGYEYGRLQSSNVRRLSRVAREAGALLVVNHHPHVVGGVEVTGEGGLQADSMGNLLFDQQVWPTFPSYLLSTDVRDGRVVRARTEPLVLQEYTPRGAVGLLADVSDRFAAGLRPGEGTSGPSGAEIVPGGPVRVARTSTGLSPDLVRRLSPGWSVDGRAGPGLQVGQELLWTGGFEDEDTGGSLGAHLWDLSGGVVSLQPDATRTGRQGVRMTTSAAARLPALLSTLHRVLLPDAGQPVTFTGWSRGSRAADLTAEIHWYGDTKGPSSSVLSQRVPVTAGWQQFRLEATPPPGTVAAQVYLRLLPARGEQELRVAVDDLRLVQWAPDGTTATPLHGAVRARGATRTQGFVTRLPAGGAALPDWISGAPLLAD